MNQDEADERAARLKELYVFMTMEDLKVLASKFVRYTTGSVDAAIDRFGSQVEEWSRVRFLACLGAVADERRESEAAAWQKSQRERDERLMANVTGYWQKVAERGAVMSDDDWREWGAKMLASNPELETVYSKRDPTENTERNRAFRGMIVAYMLKTNRADPVEV